MRPDGVRAPLADFSVVVDLPVAWGEMDAMGHVNGVVSIRYFETPGSRGWVTRRA